MSWFSRKPQPCIICAAEPDQGGSDSILGHYMGHLDDTDATSRQLRLACGCPEAVFDAESNFPSQVGDHLRSRHGLRI